MSSGARDKTPWLMVFRNKLIRGRRSDWPAEPEDEKAVVLRGVNLSGMQYSQFDWGPPPTTYVDEIGGIQAAPIPKNRWWEAAGISADLVRELAAVWKVRIIRLPINEEWLLRGLAPPGKTPLSGDEYLKDLDQIIDWAAAAGIYTLLALHTLYVPPGAQPYNAPMPDAPRRSGADKDKDTNQLWKILAERYKDDPAVLFDLFNEPHLPAKDEPVYTLPQGKDWIPYWHEWVAKFETTIHGAHPDAVLFVSGIGGPCWASSLRSMPVLSGSVPIPNAVYSTHLYCYKARDERAQNAIDGETAGKGNVRLRGTTNAKEWAHWLGSESLRLKCPIFIGEWGICGNGRCQNVECVKSAERDCKRNWRDWASRLEAYFRGLHSYKKVAGDLQWQGLAGWTAWSWGDHPHLVSRINPQTQKDERRFVRRGSSNAPSDHVATNCGDFVRNALAREAYSGYPF